MPRRNRCLVLQILLEFRLVLLLYQTSTWPQTVAQSFAELGSVLGVSGASGNGGGGGSSLPYASPRQPIPGGAGGWVDPSVLNVHPATSSSWAQVGHGSLDGPGNISSPNPEGPVFHYVVTEQRHVPGGAVPGSWMTGGSATGARVKAFLGDGGGGILVDPPNRSSLWRNRVSGAPINFRDHHLDCGATSMPLVRFDAAEEGLTCGVCGDPLAGPQSHVMGGRYVGLVPLVTRVYASGTGIPVTFFLNHTVVPGVDRVTFSLCPLSARWPEVTWECLADGAGMTIAGVGDVYFPGRAGLHSLTLHLPLGLACHRCVLQWRWQTSHMAKANQCKFLPWLRACYRPVEYINCADIAIASASSSFLESLPPLLLLAAA